MSDTDSKKKMLDTYLSHLEHIKKMVESAEATVRDTYALKRTTDLAFDAAKARAEKLVKEREMTIADIKREFPDLKIPGL